MSNDKNMTPVPTDLWDKLRAFIQGMVDDTTKSVDYATRYSYRRYAEAKELNSLIPKDIEMSEQHRFRIAEILERDEDNNVDLHRKFEIPRTMIFNYKELVDHVNSTQTQNIHFPTCGWKTVSQVYVGMRGPHNPKGTVIVVGIPPLVYREFEHQIALYRDSRDDRNYSLPEFHSLGSVGLIPGMWQGCGFFKTLEDVEYFIPRG